MRDPSIYTYVIITLPCPNELETGRKFIGNPGTNREKHFFGKEARGKGLFHIKMGDKLFFHFEKRDAPFFERTSKTLMWTPKCVCVCARVRFVLATLSN